MAAEPGLRGTQRWTIRYFAEIDFDPTTGRWYGVVYACSPDCWKEELDMALPTDLDDAERALLIAATAPSERHEEST